MVFPFRSRDSRLPVHGFLLIRQISAVAFRRTFVVGPRHHRWDGQLPERIGDLIRNPPSRPNECLNADVVETAVPVEYREGPFKTSRNRDGAMVGRATATPHDGPQPIHG